MRKLLLFATCAICCAVTQAATVGWGAAGMSAYAGSAYNFYVIGQKGVSSIATVTALLDAGQNTDSYAFGSGVVPANGNGTVLPSASGKTLDAGTYTTFIVLFDSATPKAGESKYLVLSGGANQTKTIADTTASVSFTAGNVSSIVGDASNWHDYGSGGGDVPEPTSAMLMLLGVAGLALRRKQK